LKSTFVDDGRCLIIARTQSRGLLDERLLRAAFGRKALWTKAGRKRLDESSGELGQSLDESLDESALDESVWTKAAESLDEAWTKAWTKDQSLDEAWTKAALGQKQLGRKQRLDEAWTKTVLGRKQLGRKLGRKQCLDESLDFSSAVEENKADSDSTESWTMSSVAARASVATSCSSKLQ